jgi:hypothetical protein
METNNLPTGLRRGLDRIGINNLGKGHAEIAVSIPPKESEDAPQSKRLHLLNYRAALPYAEIRIGFGTKKAVISAAGKRCVITGVPFFLDASLQPWREKLEQAAKGKGSLDDAITVRALKEILALIVAGKGHTNEVRRLYPFGLSPNVITSILSDTRLALNRTTLHTRSIVAASCSVVSTILFYVFFVLGFETKVTTDLKLSIRAAIDTSVLITALAASWAILNFATRFALRRRFPQLQMAVKQKIGKTGLTMLGGITICFIATLVLTPLRPLWLTLFTR